MVIIWYILIFHGYNTYYKNNFINDVHTSVIIISDWSIYKFSFHGRISYRY